MLNGQPSGPHRQGGGWMPREGHDTQTLYTLIHQQHPPLCFVFFRFGENHSRLAPAHLLKAREETAGLGFHVYVVRVVLSQRPACLSDVDG